MPASFPLPALNRVADLPTPFVMAHRFGCSIAPEDSIEAARLALHTPVPCLAFDVWPLADWSLAAMHDSTIDRMCTTTGNVQDHSAASWQNLVLKPSGNAGLGTGNQFALGGSGVDVWSGTYHPPLVEQILAECGGRVVLAPEVKSPLNVATGAAMARMLHRYGLDQQALLSSFTLSQLATGVSYGQCTMFLWDGATSMATIAAAGVTHVAVTIAQATSGNVAAAHAAGLKLGVYTIQRHSEWAALPAGVDFAISDDPAYVMGIVNGDYTYRRTADPFKSGTWYHGMQGGTNGTKERGYFTGGRFGFKTGASNSFTLQGWGCPVASASGSGSITTTIITFDQLDSDTSRHADIFFLAPSDAEFANAAEATDNGYVVILRQTGSLELFKKTAGVQANGPTQSTAAISVAGGTATLQIAWTPTTVTVTRTDVGSPNSVSWNESSFRGGYFHFGLAVSGGTAGHYSFSNVSIT